MKALGMIGSDFEEDFDKVQDHKLKETLCEPCIRHLEACAQAIKILRDESQ